MTENNNSECEKAFELWIDRMDAAIPIDGFRAAWKIQQNKINRLEAENVRFRAALEKIVDKLDYEMEGVMAEIASCALEGKEWKE